MKDRLRSVRSHYGLSQEEMAVKVGLGDTSWRRLELEGRAPKGEVLAMLAADDIDVNWLLTGKGELRRVVAPLNQDALIAAISLVEDWLKENRRTMTPEKKAGVVGTIYAMAMEEGQAVNARTIGRILKLVV